MNQPNTSPDPADPAKPPSHPQGSAKKPKHHVLGQGGIPVGAVMVFSLGPPPSAPPDLPHWRLPSLN